MEEKKTRKPIPYYLGYLIALVFALCITTCAITAACALTYKFISLVLGVIM